MPDDHPLLGKRKKKRAVCANPLFLQWLTEWRDEANEKGWKSAFNYSKAINSLKRYPLPLPTGKDCKILEHFGDKTCSMLDRKLAEYRAMHGGELPAPPVVDDEPVTPVKRKKKAKKAEVPVPGHRSWEPAPDPQFAHLVIPPPPDDGLNATPGGKKKTPRKDKEYIPAYRSGPYAILIALYRNQQMPHSRGYMLKKELMQDAQPLSEKSFTIPDPGSRYTAWSSMGTLVKKGLVLKASSPAKYSITDAGCELAHKILAAEQAQGGADHRVENIPQFTTNAVSPVKKPTSAVGARQKKTTQKKVPAVPPAMVETGLSGYGTHSLSDSDSDSDIVVQEDIPAEEPGPVNLSLCDATGLQFTYIDNTGKPVKKKEEACVLVDEEVSIGLLIKCNYYDLLVSPLRYKLDNSRLGHYFIRALHRELFFSAHEGTNFFALHELKCVVPRVMNNPISAPISDPHHVICDGSERNREGPNVYAYIHHEDAAACSSLQPPAGVEKPAVASGKVPTKSKKVPSVAPAAKSCVPERVEPPSSRSQLVTDLPKTFVPTAPYAASSSQESTSQDSQSSVNSVESTGSCTVPKFIFQPGEFEVVLCVDNREHFGAGCSKKNLLPELMKNGVQCDVRNLAVGDFVWIAREKVALDHNQLRAPKGRELVLDFVIERKRMDDLAGSIKDGRFKEQKFRLRQCGLRKPVYLVEKYGSAQNLSLPEDTLNQAITNTQIVDNFFVKYTNDQKESVAYLTIMTRYLQKCITRKTLIACSKDDSDDREEFDITSPQLHLMTFDEFNKCSVKNQALTVKEHFGKQLIQIYRMSQEKALALLNKYSTPQSLVSAYDQCISSKEKDNLLSSLKCGATNRNFGQALSKLVAQVYTTTGPLPP